jgi:hypothetical protein
MITVCEVSDQINETGVLPGAIDLAFMAVDAGSDG